jgi:proton-dependent oligopeptide transporter, POT family
MGSPLNDQGNSDWFGQPRGLTILFLTDTWSLFSYYGMRTLLVYYMMKQLNFAQADASYIYGTYAAFSNFAPLIGGIVSDRWLGRRLSVTVGGSIMALGHFAMISEALFFPALILVMLGLGLFMPNLPSQISGLYASDDPRRSSAYNVYYAGINLGAFLAPLICGTIGEIYGWHYGFSVAGIGMIIGMIIYWSGGKYLPSEADIKRGEIASDSNGLDSSDAVPETAALMLGEKLRILLGVAIALLVMRIAYDQQGNVLAVWTDESLDRSISQDWSIPMTWFQSINPLVIFMLTPLIVMRWRMQAEQGSEWSSCVKMVFGAALVGLSFALLSIVSHFAGDGGAKISWVWLGLSTVILTIGELFVLPVALGMFGRLAPAGAKSTVIGCYFMAGFFGNLLAGYAGGFWAYFTPAQYFLFMSAICIVSALLFAALSPRVGRIESQI